MTWTVGQVAAASGVSVRTLHHYDAIGLVVPGGRSPAGYREYDQADVARLRDVLAYRELGFPLDRVAALLDAPGSTRRSHLLDQRAIVQERLGRLRDVLTHLDRMLEAHAMGTDLTPEEQLEVFGDDWLGADYAAEAQERWGDTDAWRQSQQRTAGFTKADWQQVKADGDALEADLADALRRGVPPSDPVAMDLAERHRASVGRFCDCGYPMHRGLADMYLADPRFTAHYDDLEPGLAQWLHDAVHANADRHPA